MVLMKRVILLIQILKIKILQTAVQPVCFWILPKELTGIHHAEIEVKDYGTIDVELDADTAPITVTNFVKLAQEGFYDGLTFHRIMDGFMIQGVIPTETEQVALRRIFKG